jgi:CRISPR-associated protein Csh1
MEWLQTYKIGKALLDSGKYEPIDAYFQNYRPSKSKNPPFEPKNAYVLSIMLDTSNSGINVEISQYDELSVKKDTFLSTISGNFTSYYLCTPFTKKESILDFFGISKGLVIESDSKKLTGIEKEYELLIKKELLKPQFRDSQLLQYRNKLREDGLLVKKLCCVVENLNTILTNRKNIDGDKILEVFKDETSHEPDVVNIIRNLDKRFSMGDNGLDEIAYLKVAIDGFFLSQFPEYKEFCFKRFVSFGKIESKSRINASCYFSQEPIAYAIELPRDSINILKTSVGSYTSQPYFKGSSFLVSENAYNALKLGAKYIAQNLIVRIAGISHYVIPEFTKNFQVERLESSIKDNLELAFTLKEYDDTKRDIYRLSKEGINAISLVGFIKGKGTIDFINTIRIANPRHFDELFELLEKCKEELFLKPTALSLQSIYRLFPLSSQKTKKPTSLALYKSLFERTPIAKGYLLENYRELINIYRFGKPDKDEKFYGGTVNIPFIKQREFDVEISLATKKYQVLFNLINHIFQNNTDMMDYSLFNEKTKSFFEASKYNEAQVALFFLGKLLRRVANTQSMKQKNGRKPILDKVNYSGMKVNDIKWLKCEIIEKFNQYEINFYEKDLRFFEEYFAKAEICWQLQDIENTFYLFSGYAMYWETIEAKEKKHLSQSQESIDDAQSINQDLEDESNEDEQKDYNLN